MHSSDEIRLLARDYATRARAVADGKTDAGSLLAAAAALTGVSAVPVAADDPVLDGGTAEFDPEAETIWYRQDLSPGFAHFVLAHEYAHFWLDDGPATCAAPDLDAEAPDEPLAFGVQRVEGYGPHERREQSANLFAREFLLPGDLLRAWYLVDGMDAPAIAAHVGVAAGTVYHQLARALLTPPPVADRAGDAPVAGATPLDPGQEEAARAPHGPLLVEAGPGTGKTRTLIGRIQHLLGEGVSPAAILALTFSNKAAEEMRVRIADVAPAAAPHVWMGTFHAFGLELLRKWGTALGLPPPIAVIDPVDALILLEGELPSLALAHYQNLYDPAMYLRDLLGAISRAKDELVGPEQYAALARAMRDTAATPEAVEAAERALEVAHVYAVYEQRLARAGFVDFGDLIVKSVQLLRAHPEVRAAVRQQYRHILVDEYQDVNRASGLLLKEIAGDGRGLWVVGDARQAIYRFRGAAPGNMRLFADDFPGARVRILARNYRSQPAIVDVVAALAPQMRAADGTDFVPWEPNRADGGGTVHLAVATDHVAEGAGIAGEVRRLRADGVRYRDQAVLARTHTVLARVAAELERANIPVLYLGDLFERPEIRDLLSLVSLAAGPDGRGLVRVAGFPEYRIPLADVRVLLAAAREQQVPFPRALDLAGEIDGISPGGKAALAVLARHLDGLCSGRSAWDLLVRYLLDRGAYLRPLVAGESLALQQRCLAIYQFLQFAQEYRVRPTQPGMEPKRAFLAYVRRLAVTGEDRQLRQVPEWAAGIDAVRMLTVHASKGLEFGAVFLPALGQGYFPLRNQGNRCPPPHGMLADPRDDEHEEEEECLFFVALSRARDHLCLSRAERYGKQNSTPSRLLGMIAHRLPYPVSGPATWANAAAPADPPPGPRATPATRPSYTADMLDQYRDCPRKFHYEYVLGLGGRDEASAYVQFHQCVYAVLRWFQAERADGRAVDEAGAVEKLGAVWQEAGPHDHAYAELYWEQAAGMVRRAIGYPLWVRRRSVAAKWEVSLPHGRVRITPDVVIPAGPDGDSRPVVQRLRTGRPTAEEAKRDIYALYQVAAREHFPDAQPSVEIVYLAYDEVVPVALSDKMVATRLAHYDDALADILRGTFPAKPNDRACPRCPYYFICPVADGASE